MEIYGNPWIFMEIDGIPWNSMELPWGIHGVSTEFHGMPWRSMEYPWSSMECHGVPWSSLKYWWSSLEVHGIPWNIVEFHRMPWGSLKYWWSSMECHSMFMEFDRIPCSLYMWEKPYKSWEIKQLINLLTTCSSLHFLSDSKIGNIWKLSKSKIKCVYFKLHRQCKSIVHRCWKSPCKKFYC